MKKISVTAAILHNNNQILCLQRGDGKYEYVSRKYEFPGGKVEPNESLEACLSRELDEELQVVHDVKKGHYFMTVDHDYPDFSIEMHAFLIEVESREFVMNEHIDYRWLEVSELSRLDWAPADIPIVEKLMREYHGTVL